MINIILFSKDRPAQLDLFLSSCKEYASDLFPINVLYTYSTEEYKKGYSKVKEYHVDVNFIKEQSFKKDLLSLVKDDPYTVFFVDDIIWKDYFSIQDLKILNEPHILCTSLRLHPNLNYCYTADVPMTKPKTYKNGCWYWKMEPIPSDYSYPMSVDGNFYRTKDILSLLQNLEYKNPNSLEAILSLNPLPQAKMFCYEESKIVNNPCNKVQTNNTNKFGTISAKFLNSEFLAGKRLDFLPYKGLKNLSCHTELPVYWK